MAQQQASEWYMYDANQGIHTFFKPLLPSTHNRASFIRPPSPFSLANSDNDQKHAPQPPPYRSPYLHNSQTRIQSQSSQPSYTTHDTSDEEEPSQRLASGRSSLGDISRPGSVFSVGVNRNGVRGRRGPSQSPHPPPPFRGRGSLSYDSPIQSPSPGPSPVSEVEQPNIPAVIIGGAQRQMTGSCVGEGSIPYPHEARYGMTSPTIPSEISGPREEMLGRASMVVGNETPSRDQESYAPSPTCTAPASVSHAMTTSMHQRGDYVVQPQIEMNSFISKSLPSPKPFRRIPTAEVVAKRRERYARLNSEVEDVENGAIEGKEETWWRRHVWLRWVVASVVWGVLWFVVGGSLGFVMRRSGT